MNIKNKKKANSKMKKEQINKLIKKSFGRFFSGDWKIVPDGVGEWCAGSAYRDESELELIARPSFWNIIEAIPFFQILYSPNCVTAGIFLKEDGSRLVVDKKYSAQSKDYTRRYEKATGNKPEIIYR